MEADSKVALAGPKPEREEGCDEKLVPRGAFSWPLIPKPLSPHFSLAGMSSLSRQLSFEDSAEHSLSGDKACPRRTLPDTGFSQHSSEKDKPGTSEAEGL